MNELFLTRFVLGASLFALAWKHWAGRRIIKHAAEGLASISHPRIAALIRELVQTAEKAYPQKGSGADKKAYVNERILDNITQSQGKKISGMIETEVAKMKGDKHVSDAARVEHSDSR